jgi:hypothetical protein
MSSQAFRMATEYRIAAKNAGIRRNAESLAKLQQKRNDPQIAQTTQISVISSLRCLTAARRIWFPVVHSLLVPGFRLPASGFWLPTVPTDWHIVDH